MKSPRLLVVTDLIILLQFVLTVSAIRLHESIVERHNCRSTVQGRFLLSDDNGYVCDALSLDPDSSCCPLKGKQFTCQGCNLASQCCNSYEFCVSCCQNPAKTRKKLALKVKIAKPVTAGYNPVIAQIHGILHEKIEGTYSNVFDYCAGRCRHNSESVVHENAYFSDFHHCFSLPSNSTATTEALAEAKLAGINITVGRQGESCDSVCKLNGQSCVPNKLMLLNECKTMQKYMRCKGTCLASIGADQPAEVVDDAPTDLNPGACLYTKTESVLSCDGSHQHTRRLCPCA